MNINFWEIASLFLQVVQMGLYLAGVDKYKDKLEEFAQWLCDCADINRDYYKEFRDCDPSFYAYYKSLPDYSICESNVKRAKGAAFHDYGKALRRGLTSVRGFSPLARIHINNLQSGNAVNEAAVTRAATYIRERQRSNSHVLARWHAIVNAPIGVERYSVSSSNGIIQQSFKSLRAAGQGFNSAGAAFGTQLYRVLN